MSKLVIDIGGTRAKYKLNDGPLKYFQTLNHDKEYVLTKIADLISKYKIEQVGIASPCGVDPTTGQLYGQSGIKDYANFNLYEELKARIKHPFQIIAYNDANAALLGNLMKQNLRSAAQITVGTGIGGALYLDNKIINNKWAMAGEFGYIPLSQKRNLSQVCSASALVAMINRDFDLACETFEQILKTKVDFTFILKRWANNFAQLLSSVFFAFAPEKVFISGGITQNQVIQQAIRLAFEKLMRAHHYDFAFEFEFKNLHNPALVGMASLLKG